MLSNPYIAHGILESAPPLSLMPGDSKAFDMSQSYFFGPDIILNYQCGEKSISFEVQQNLSIWFGSYPEATTLKSNGLEINSLNHSSSKFYNSVGICAISIEPSVAG